MATPFPALAAQIATLAERVGLRGPAALAAALTQYGVPVTTQGAWNYLAGIRRPSGPVLGSMVEAFGLVADEELAFRRLAAEGPQGEDPPHEPPDVLDAVTPASAGTV